MKKILIITVLFLMIFTVPTFAGLYNRSTGTCIVDGSFIDEVWMDDFGSGYSSLTLLKDYNFDLLKMDMNFLTSLSERSKKVLQSVVLMAKELGIKTLAEGVETKEEMAFLKEIGCGKMQGYYFGKPQPIEEMFAHLEEYRFKPKQGNKVDFMKKHASI